MNQPTEVITTETAVATTSEATITPIGNELEVIASTPTGMAECQV